LIANRQENHFFLQIQHIGALCLFIGICYYPSLGVPFVFDDFPNIVANPAVHPENISQLPAAVFSKVTATRPLAMLSFGVNYLFGYMDVFGYHLVNIIIHIINTLLLYRICIIFPTRSYEKPETNLIHRQSAAFWGAALWALNPVQTQAVTYIVQRMTSMATLFYLAGIYLFLLWRNHRVHTNWTVAGLAICFFLGLASKEIIVTLPFALLLLDYLCFPSTRNRKKALVTVIVATSAIFTLGILYLEGQLPDWQTTYTGRNFNPIERVMTQWRVVWHYVSLFLLPNPGRLHLAYDPIVSRSLFQPWTTLAGLLALLFTGYGAWHIRKKYAVLSFAILFFFLAQIVESSFINLELAFIHRLYLPSLFLPFAAISLIPGNMSKKVGIPLLAIISLWSFWTINRNVEWSTARDFWQADLARGAGTARALNNQAAALIDEGRYEEAIPILKEGLPTASAEQRKDINYNLGVALYITKSYEEALQTFQTVLQENGLYLNTLLYVGQTFLAQGRKEDAEKIVKMLSAVTDKRYQGAIMQANIHASEGEYAEAEDVLLAAIEEESAADLGRWLKLKLELASVYLKSNKRKEAYETYLQITQRFPQNLFAWKQIYFMLTDGGDKKSAAVIKRYLETKGVEIKN
jgi:tetratricopeptide (TPR) repeat protein